MDTLQLVDNKKVQVYTLRKGLSDTVMYDEPSGQRPVWFCAEAPHGLQRTPGRPIGQHYRDFRYWRKDRDYSGAGVRNDRTPLRGTQKDELVFVEKGIKPRIIQLLKDGEEEAEFSKPWRPSGATFPFHLLFPQKSGPKHLISKSGSALRRTGVSHPLGARQTNVWRRGYGRRERFPRKGGAGSRR